MYMLHIYFISMGGDSRIDIAADLTTFLSEETKFREEEKERLLGQGFSGERRN